MSQNNLLSLQRPDLCREWDYKKNKILTPDNVPYNSRKKAWWICKNNNNHSWKTSVNVRANGHQCPYCQHRKTSRETSLAVVNPELAKEWHPTKNGKITPYDVMPQSNIKRWWRCKDGHESERSPNYRYKSPKCSICVMLESSFAVKHPYLLKEWDYKKNKNIDPYFTKFYEKYWWKCHLDHSWKANIQSRVRGSGCPYCAAQKASKENCLATLNPKLAKEWHPTKNGKLTPRNITAMSARKVWWQCKKGHEWRAIISNRSNKGKCPYCSGRKHDRDTGKLAISYPYLLKEWDYEKNKEIDPNILSYGSRKQYWWKCEKQHSFQSSLNNRTNNNSTCPYCNNSLVCKDNNLVVINPRLAGEWNYIKNKGLLPQDFLPTSVKKVWWICSLKKHEWESSINTRNKGHGCPYCSGHKTSDANRLTILAPELLLEWHPTKNTNINSYDLSIGSRTRPWWICKKGHEWQASVKTRALGHGCPKCKGYMLKNGIHLDSLIEVWYYFKFKKENKNFICNKKYPKVNDKQLGKRQGCRFDFYFPEENKYLEVTSYSAKYSRSEEQYLKYIDRIKMKENYVINELGAKFEFIQKQLTPQEVILLKKS